MGLFASFIGARQRFEEASFRIRQFGDVARRLLQAFVESAFSGGHVDNRWIGRIQTVDERRNPRFYRLLEAFDRLTEDLVAGRLSDEVPRHGTLVRIRRSGGLALSQAPSGGSNGATNAANAAKATKAASVSLTTA